MPGRVGTRHSNPGHHASRPTLRNLLGKLDSPPVETEATALLDRLPANYRPFLAQHNGGFPDEYASNDATIVRLADSFCAWRGGRRELSKTD